MRNLGILIGAVLFFAPIILSIVWAITIALEEREKGGRNYAIRTLGRTTKTTRRRTRNN